MNCRNGVFSVSPPFGYSLGFTQLARKDIIISVFMGPPRSRFRVPAKALGFRSGQRHSKIGLGPTSDASYPQATNPMPRYAQTASKTPSRL